MQAEQFDNQMAKIYKFRGTKPEAVTWGAMNSEIYSERDRIKSNAFEFAGISQMSAMGKLPSQARLDSAPALNEYNAIEDARFNDKTQNYELSTKQVASHFIELYADKYKNNKKSKSTRTFRLGNLVEQIEWKDVDMSKDKFVLEIGASSIINMTPAARKDLLNSWLAGGIITPDQYKAWSGHEDLERLADMMSASKDYAEHQISRMLAGERVTPDPNMNLPAALSSVLDTYQHLCTLDCPDEIKSLFRNWVVSARNYMQPPAPPMGPMAMGPAGPQGPPMGDAPQPGMEAPIPAPPIGMQ